MFQFFGILLIDELSSGPAIDEGESFNTFIFTFFDFDRERNCIGSNVSCYNVNI